ncbi:MAG: hypothetical protein HY913_01535 [Desulfomonile tiedjei]|nr:hypothetical protein [Desulfomonile tiedjei]
MESNRTICVVCAWRQTCNKKFSMDGATSTKCPEFTRDVTLPLERQVEKEEESK